MDESQPQRQQRQTHRAIANARERNRTESVNYAFNLLRNQLPTDPPNRKLSKIEILRLSISYIEHLDNVRNALANNEPIDKVCHRTQTPKDKCPTMTCTFCITASKFNSTNVGHDNTTTQCLLTPEQSNPEMTTLDCNQCYCEHPQTESWKDVDYLPII